MARAALVPLLLVLLLAGCSSPQPEAVAEAPLPPPVPVSEDVDWQATMAGSNCVQTASVNVCGSFFALNGADPEPTYFHDADGRDLAGGNVTLEWTALTPTTEALQLRLQAWDGCPDECAVNRTLATVDGKSPIRMTVPAYPLMDGMMVGLRVSPLPFAPGMMMSTSQDVHLTGSLSFVERPDAEPKPDWDDETVE